MKINWNSKYTTISVYTIITFSVCVLIYAVLFNFTMMGDFIRKMTKILAPIIWGVVIAYLVNPIMKWFERKLQKPIEKNRPHFKIVRILSLTLAMVVFLAVIAALGAIILPQVIESITTILNNVTTYVNNFEKWIDSFLVKYPDVLTIA